MAVDGSVDKVCTTLDVPEFGCLVHRTIHRWNFPFELKKSE